MCASADSRCSSSKSNSAALRVLPMLIAEVLVAQHILNVKRYNYWARSNDLASGTSLALAVLT